MTESIGKPKDLWKALISIGLPNKASSSETPSYLFKKCDFVLDTVTVCVNEALKTGSFTDGLKCTNIRQIYKKENPFDKENYRQ